MYSLTISLNAVTVALARVLFPREAKLAMEMARADSTSEFAGLSSTEGNPRCLDPKELPPFQVKQLKDRMEALQNTGKLVILSTIYINNKRAV